MICPHCQSEYREGFNKCADCGVELVSELPDSNEQESQIEFNQDEAVEILQLANFTDISFVKSLFEAENIKYSSSGESMVGKAGAGIMARIFIRKSDVEKAVPLLKSAGLL